jgi:hypothetical protein
LTYVTDVDRGRRGTPLDDRTTISLQVDWRESPSSNLFRHTGSNSRSKTDRRMARVLSAIGAAVRHFSPNSPKVLASRRRRFSRCLSIAGDRPLGVDAQLS